MLTHSGSRLLALSLLASSCLTSSNSQLTSAQPLSTGDGADATAAEGTSPMAATGTEAQPAAAAADPAPTQAPAQGATPSPPTDPGEDVGTQGDGDHTIAQPFEAATEMAVDSAVPQGEVLPFQMRSADSKIFTGMDPTLSQPGAFSRDGWLYRPRQIAAGAAAAAGKDGSPFMVVMDGGGYLRMAHVLDNLIAAKKIPAMLTVFINPGPGDGRGSERGLEYDTVSDAYVRFVEEELLPYVADKFTVKFTSDPYGRGSMGGSSGGAAAFTMAWFRPDLYRRVLTYSGTYVNQHPDQTYPHSAWSYHEFLIAQSPAKPMRVFLEVGSNDNQLDGTFGDGMHNWMTANKNMAKQLAAKSYHYQFIWADGAGHVDGGVVDQTLPNALVWLWRGYPLT